MASISTESQILVLDIDGILLKSEHEEITSIAFARAFPFLYTHTGLQRIEYRQEVIERGEHFRTDGVARIAAILRDLSKTFDSFIIWHTADGLPFLSSALSIVSLNQRNPVVCAGTVATASKLEIAAVLFDAVLAASSPLPDINPPVFLCSYRELFAGTGVTLSTADSRQPFLGHKLPFPWHHYDEVKKNALTAHFRVHWMPHEEDQRRADGLVYVGCRLFFRIMPRHPSLPEAMTKDKANAIVAAEGETLDISVFSTPFLQGFRPAGALPEYQPYAFTRAPLLRAVFHDTPPIERSDGSLLMEFHVDDHEFLSLLCDRRDPVWGVRRAFERKAVHWGTENWGGLSIELRLKDKRLYRCEVDAFAPDDTSLLTSSLYVSAISMDPAQYGEDERSQPELDMTQPGEEEGNENVERVKSAIEPADDDVPVGKCLQCGTTLRLNAGMLSMTSMQGGFALVPCKGCGQGAMVRVLSQDEANRTGFSTEVIKQRHQAPFDT